MDKTEVILKAYKHTGKFDYLEAMSTSKEPWETGKILEEVYVNFPKLKFTNFTMDAFTNGYYNGRLVLNAIE